MERKTLKMNLLNKILRLSFLLICISFKGWAQLAPFQSMYYQNRYLLNPALAGTDNGLVINMNYQQQWSSFPGTPKTGLLTMDYAATDKVGLGLSVTNDESGIIRTTTMFGSYAYHLRLDDLNEQHLHFGLSLGLNDSRIDYNKVKGDMTDDELSRYNTLAPYIDGSLGIAYSNNHGLLLSVMAPNLSATLLGTSDTRYNNDQLIFITAAAYKIVFPVENNGFSIEPMMAFRKVKGYSDIFDAGIKTSITNGGKAFLFQLVYHTDRTLNGGFGVDLDKVTIIFNYTFDTGPLSSFTNGGGEIGIRLHLFNEGNSRN